MIEVRWITYDIWINDDVDAFAFFISQFNISYFWYDNLTDFLVYSWYWITFLRIHEKHLFFLVFVEDNMVSNKGRTVEELEDDFM